MILPNWAVRNGAFVLVAVLLLTLIGAISYRSMPRSEDPSINLPIYVITVVYPGTSPADMEDLIVDPIEDVVEEMDDVENVITSISEGLAVIRVEADFGTPDWDDKYDEILREMNALRPELPQGIAIFNVEQFKQEDRAVVHMLALTSPNLPFRLMESEAERIKDLVLDVDGVKSIDVEAFPERQVQISLDFQRCQALHIPPAQIIGVLEQTNANVPGGELSAGQQNFSIKTSGGFET
ncbi:MAG: efflux RND transporter permease subunit, partial [Bacteroidota bacterium]